jgi:oligopeptide transport system substrate-binding protein
VAATPTSGQTPSSEPAATPTNPPQPIVARVDLGPRPETLDPALAAPLDAAGNDLIESLFIGLTSLDPNTGRVEPALAREWERSEDELTWTVYLRDDVFWVQANPATGQIEIIRPVAAGDVVYAVERACQAETGAPLAGSLFIIQGCRDLYGQAPDATLGARVLNDVVVEFKLASDSSAFPAILSMPVMRPLPADLLDAAGEGWTEPANLWTSGPFTVQPTVDPAAGYTLLANPHWPLEHTGNLDAVQVSFDPSSEEALSAWQSGDLDASALPADAVGTIPFGETPGYVLLARPATTFLAASYDTPPMDNPDVRRALALALDRQALINTVLEPAGQTAIPAGVITPPGTASAPAYEDVGVSYDPDAARSTLASAGYSGCSTMTPITLLTDDSALSVTLANRLIEMWASVLGCQGRFLLEQRPFQEVLVFLHEPPGAIQRQFRGPRPGLILLSWQADAPDAQHWLAGIMGCRETFPDAYLNSARPCIDADQRLSEAASTHDESARADLYQEIEAAYFGPEGEMPVIPLYFHTRALAVQPWVQMGTSQAGPLHFDRWIIDLAQRP